MRWFFRLKNRVVSAGIVIAALSAPLSASCADLRGLEDGFSKVDETVGPAVVTVAMERTGKIARQAVLAQGPFNQYIMGYLGGLPEREFKQQGLGSGIIFDKRGFILTNQHVIEGATRITVILPDSRAFPAAILGEDRRKDLAVLKIDAPDLPVAEFGDSDKLRPGQWAIAIGNPFGHIVKSSQPTVTVGVISALHRSLPVASQAMDRSYINLIQTDAAINTGNSGGPLCDIEGKVVGINVAMLNQGGGNVDIGFAIPINTVKLVLGDLMSGKKIAYGWMGVGVQDITPEMAGYFGLSSTSGVLVAAIVNDGPAAKAGIRPGDVILRFKGEDVKDTQGLMDKISNAAPGETVGLDIVREKRLGRVQVAISNRPGQEGAAQPQEKPVAAKEPVVEWRGLKVSAVTEELAERFRLAGRTGVAVTDAAEQSPSYAAGLRPGDVIKEVNRQPVASIIDFKKAVEQLKGNALVLTENGYYIVEEKI